MSETNFALSLTLHQRPTPKLAPPQQRVTPHQHTSNAYLGQNVVDVWHHPSRVTQLAAIADPLQQQLLVHGIVLGGLDVGGGNVLAVGQLAVDLPQLPALALRQGKLQHIKALRHILLLLQLRLRLSLHNTL